MSPLNRRRLAIFRSSRRGVYSLTVFGILFFLSLFAELLANDKPFLIFYDGGFYSPLVREYPETTFGGDFPTNAVYRDPEVQKLIEAKGWMIWPPIPYSYDTVLRGEGRKALMPPSWDHWLGTDDQARDVLARVIYGFRISVMFGLVLTIISSVVGVVAGAVQGYLGGWVDLIFQRLIEIWTSIPSLYLLLIISSVLAPSFWVLLGILLLFSWVTLVGVVRAEFLRGRNFEYVAAARALGVDVLATKLKAISLSAAITAAAGCLYVQNFLYLDANIGFGTWISVEVLIAAILGGIGTAGVPSGSLPVVALICGMVGVPPEGIGLILGVDRFLDMCRTTLNVTGDLVAAAVVSRGEEDTHGLAER